MTPVEKPQGGSYGKVTPFCDSRVLTTYKRRRCDSGNPTGTRNCDSETEHVTRSRHDGFPRSGAIKDDKIRRITTNWRNTLESLLRDKDVVGDDGAEFCVKKALACDPFGFSHQQYKGSVRPSRQRKAPEEMKSMAVLELIQLDSRRSLRSSDGKSELNLHGTNRLRDQQLGVNTTNCQNVLCDIMTSEKFALLCDLLGEKLESNQAFGFDISPVFSKLKKGIYEQSTDFFDQDMQLVWEKYMRVGQDMAVLSNSLLSISRQSYLRRVQIGRTTCSVPVVGNQNQVLSDRSNRLTNQQNSPPKNRAVCERLAVSSPQGNASKNLDILTVPRSSRECSVSSMEDDDSLEPSRTEVMRLCKQCGTCEDEEKRFLVCSNKYCIYKYYHIRCLKSTQLASKHQPPGLWYCPSCLCRGCLVDKDDDLICLCDLCGEGYHIYCMNPSRTSIPKGAFYCFACNGLKTKKGTRIYEQQVSHIHGKSGIKYVKQPGD